MYTGDADGEHRMKFAKGTTTLAFKFKGGVLVAVDPRSTQGPYIGESLCAPQRPSLRSQRPSRRTAPPSLRLALEPSPPPPSPPSLIPLPL